MAKPSIDYSNLTAKERLQMIEEIWESLSSDPQCLPVTDDQRQELDRRLDALDRGEVKTVPWEEVRESLWNKDT